MYANTWGKELVDHKRSRHRLWVKPHSFMRNANNVGDATWRTRVYSTDVKNVMFRQRIYKKKETNNSSEPRKKS